MLQTIEIRQPSVRSQVTQLEPQVEFLYTTGAFKSILRIYSLAMLYTMVAVLVTFAQRSNTGYVWSLSLTAAAFEILGVFLYGFWVSYSRCLG